MIKLDLEPAFVLHSRAFKESSLILELFTKNHGHISAIAKGAKRPKSKFRGIVQPFNSMLISGSARSELLTLTVAESTEPRIELKAQGLLSGIYLNELLMKLFSKNEAYPKLFDYYLEVLQILSKEPHNVAVLRYFEKELLEILGYGLDLKYDAISKQEIIASQKYIFNPYDGFFLYRESELKNNIVVSGSTIISLREQSLIEKESFIEAKRILRFALMLHLKSSLKSSMFYKKVKVADPKKELVLND